MKKLILALALIGLVSSVSLVKANQVFNAKSITQAEDEEGMDEEGMDEEDADEEECD